MEGERSDQMKKKRFHLKDYPWFHTNKLFIRRQQKNIRDHNRFDPPIINNPPPLPDTMPALESSSLLLPSTISTEKLSSKSRINKKHGQQADDPSSVPPLLLVSSSLSSHVPVRPRSSTSTCSSVTGPSTSLRSAYSNNPSHLDEGDANVEDGQDGRSIICSDRLHHYHFGTPPNGYLGQNNDDDDEDGVYSRFSYDATIQQNYQHPRRVATTSSIASSSLHQPQEQQASRTPLLFLRRQPYFQSSFASSHRQKSFVSNTSSGNRMHHASSSAKDPHSGSHILFLGRSLPDFETLVYCSSCEKWIQSRLRYKSGAMVWLASFVLLMCTVFLFWIPFYIKYFKDTIHYCPSCGREIGRHSLL